jgi:STAND-like protein
MYDSSASSVRAGAGSWESVIDRNKVKCRRPSEGLPVYPIQMFSLLNQELVSHFSMMSNSGWQVDERTVAIGLFWLVRVRVDWADGYGTGLSTVRLYGRILRLRCASLVNILPHRVATASHSPGPYRESRYHQFEPLFSLPSPLRPGSRSTRPDLTPSLQLKIRHGEQSIFLMSSTGQVTFPTENVKLTIDALADYAREIGKDLSENPFATNIEQSKSSEDILQLLEEREKAFQEYRAGNRRLIDYLNPAVKVLHRFSGILGQAASLVSQLCHLVNLLT